MNFVTFIGLAAATMTTCCFIPQVLLVMRHRKTDGISLLMYCVFAVGITLWLLYGILLSSLPIILSNAVTLVLVILIIVMKMRLG